MIFRLGSVLAMASLVGCASTPSQPPFRGSPSVEVERITGEEIQARFSVNCLEGGGKVVQSSLYSLTCSTPMGTSFQHMMYRALLTENNASTPDILLQFAWVKVSSGKMKVTATAWVEHQNAFGKSTRNSLDADATKYELQAALNGFKKNVDSETHSR